jgi:hypothetical protein
MSKSAIASSIEFVFSDIYSNRQAKITQEKEDLLFSPSIEECLSAIYDIIWFGKCGVYLPGDYGEISIGKFKLTFDKINKSTKIEWLSASIPPAPFTEFEGAWHKQWDKYNSLTSFW